MAAGFPRLVLESDCRQKRTIMPIENNPNRRLLNMMRRQECGNEKLELITRGESVRVEPRGGKVGVSVEIVASGIVTR